MYSPGAASLGIFCDMDSSSAVVLVVDLSSTSVSSMMTLTQIHRFVATRCISMNRAAILRSRFRFISIYNTGNRVFRRFKKSCRSDQWRIQDFPEVGAPTPGGRQHTILGNFPKNCMTFKEFGPHAPLRSATADISANFVDICLCVNIMLSPEFAFAKNISIHIDLIFVKF